MPRSVCAGVLLAGLVVVWTGGAVSLVAQQQMPDPAQMAGVPLPAPELEPGMVSVRVVRERMGNNVTGQAVSLRAAGKTLGGTTDAQGRAIFGDLPVGTAVTVDAVVDGETLRSQEFTIPSRGGIRVALIAGLAAARAREQTEREAAAKQPARAGVVVFGGESRVIMEFQDDNLQVFYLLDIINNARTPIDVGEPLMIVLPEGAVGAGALEGSTTQATVQGDRIRINGPFAPGTTSLQVGYRFPYSGSTATISQVWPAAIEQVFVAAEKVGEIQMSSPQFKQQQEANAGGSPFLMATGGRVNAGESLTVTLTGLPHQSLVLRNVGLAVGAAILAIGLWLAVTGRTESSDLGDQLARRKEKLLTELVALEEDRRAGRVDDRRYGTRRPELVAQLERVMKDLDQLPQQGGGGVAA